MESNKNYCFRIILRDSLTKAEIGSNEACTINFKSILLSDEKVRLDWSKIDISDLSRIDITYMEENGDNRNSIYIDLLSDTTFVFDYLQCSKRYKFHITSTSKFVSANKRTIIKSSQILVDPKSLKTLPAPQSIGIVSVSGDSLVRYNLFTLSQIPKYEFYKSTNGSEMIKIDESSGNVFEDRNADTRKNHYCYAFRYINNCGTKSELSENSCTIKLSSETYGRLSWTPFTIHADTNLFKGEKAVYNVQFIDNEGVVVSTIGNTMDTTIVIDIERFLVNWSTNKFRVLAQIQGKLYLNSQFISFPMFGYSNSAILYTILSNESSKNDFSVFPNPGEDKIRINSSGAPVQFVELIDMKGRIVHKGEIADDTFNLSAFDKGKYILRLYDSNNKLLNTKNIVKW